MGFTAKMNEMANKANPLASVSPDYPVGILPAYHLPPDRKITIREFIEAKIKSDFGPEGPELFKKCAFVPYRISIKEGYNYWHKPEDTIRLPVYYQRMVANGEKFKKQLAEKNATVPNQDMEHVDSHYSGMPVWYTEESHMLPTADFPFKLVNWKIHYGVNNTGGLYDNAYLHEIIDYSNPTIKYIQFPVSQAAKYGLKEGDRIRVETPYGGTTEGRVHLSHFIHPQCLGIPGNFRQRTRYQLPLKSQGVYFNSLVSHETKTLNPISVSLESSLPAKITKI
jgi:anaerobic selenocysteine-containing dehydrogenase